MRYSNQLLIILIQASKSIVNCILQLQLAHLRFSHIWNLDHRTVALELTRFFGLQFPFEKGCPIKREHFPVK
jgi:hypothetical protein